MNNINEENIYKLLNEDIKSKIKIDVKDSVGSTNDEVKRRAVSGEAEGYLLVARSQTRGKGRLGRSFYSPANTGIYMSLLLRPQCKAEETTLITTAAAVAVCKALEKLGVTPAIKWVNDIFVKGKKVCGILTEAGFCGGERLSYAVLGIGVNIYTPENDFPEDLKNIAGAVLTQENENDCNLFIAEFLNEFFPFYSCISERRHIAQYREKCFVLGKQINVISQEKTIPAKAVDIDENCNLIAELCTGETVTLGTGEISIIVAEEELGNLTNNIVLK